MFDPKFLSLSIRVSYHVLYKTTFIRIYGSPATKMRHHCFSSNIVRRRQGFWGNSNV